jgi:hypothetical protein
MTFAASQLDLNRVASPLAGSKQSSAGRLSFFAAFGPQRAGPSNPTHPTRSRLRQKCKWVPVNCKRLSRLFCASLLFHLNPMTDYAL